MLNIKLIIEYDGTNFYGWQIQQQKRTVEGVITKTLFQILGEKVKVIGACRTDTGVHAEKQVANFKTNQKINLIVLKKALNSILPKDVIIKTISLKNSKFHSRFNAKSKVYEYRIMKKYSPFLRNYAIYLPFVLNINKMKESILYLKGKYDFLPFGVKLEKGQRTILEVKDIKLIDRKKEIFFKIEASFFLRKMIRSIMGILIEIGRNKLEPHCIKEILDGKKLYKWQLMPAHGLYLIKVNY